MSRAATVERAVEQVVALGRIAHAVTDSRERRRLDRVRRQLRRTIGPGIPKRRAAALLGVSVPALERWIARGHLPVVRRPGVSRAEIDADALIVLATEVGRLREQGEQRNVLSTAFARLDEQGALPRQLRPNEPASELRAFFQQTTPVERLRIGAELSAVGATLAARGTAR